MSTGRNRRTLAAVLAGTALVGAGGGAAVYEALNSSSSTRTVTVTTATPTSPVVASSDLTVGQIYERNNPGVVEIDVTSAGNSQSFPFGRGESRAQGSGFVIDKAGHVVTNAHVVSGASSVSIKFSDSASYDASIVGSDPTTDVAVVKVDAPSSELHPLSFGDSTHVAVGDGVVAIGAPFGLDGTVTSGIVSAVGREIQSPNNSAIADTIQTDAAINHGNSGGPLFDMQGKVIGITSQIESDSGGNDGVGFAVASHTVQRVVKSLIANGKVTHAFLGVQVQTLPNQAAQALGESPGVAVATVESGSAAAKAGLKAATGTKDVGGQSYPVGGDVITAIGGTEVRTAGELKTAIEAHSPGDTVKLTASRGGKTRTVTVTLGSR